MALPPEQIKIKRRREEEPVETLYIQSELHQKKRRFTDFVFQRVRHDGDGSQGSPGAGTPATSAATRDVRSPRSVSTSVFPSLPFRGRDTVEGVPLVRATSPGAEFREERRIAAARREAEEKRRRALESGPSPLKPRRSGDLGHVTGQRDRQSPQSRGRGTPASSVTSSPPSFPSSLRRFHISRPNTPMHKAGRGGRVRKRRGGMFARGAVLVEKLTVTPALAELVEQTKDLPVSAPLRGETAEVGQEQAVRPRKRPVVNEAEKRWKEEHKTSITVAKANITSKFDGSGDMDRLARDLEQVVLDLENKDNNAQEIRPTDPIPPSLSTGLVFPKPPPLKYQPRPPKSKSRTVSSEVQRVQVPETMQVEPSAPVTTRDNEMDEGDGGDSDGDYVYDTYVRRPLSAGLMLTNPVLDTEADSDALHRQTGIDRTRKDIGVVVITEEDEALWDNFAEDEDEKNWDSEDVDSNAEDNPANDYPDDELSSADEFDDPTAIYSRYRRAASDDEEFDIDEFDDGEGDGEGLGTRKRHGLGRSGHGCGDSDDDIHEHEYDDDDVGSF